MNPFDPFAGEGPAFPGPVAAPISAHRFDQALRTLRPAAARHDDTAWLRPRPMPVTENLATFSQDLLDAIGAVGLAPPRAVGERHLLRSLVHLVHGPVRHLIVEHAELVGTDTLAELHQTALLGSVQLWLLIDPAGSLGGPSLRGEADQAVRHWVRDTCTTRHADAVINDWTGRPVKTGLCAAPRLPWWTSTLGDTWPPKPCRQHQTIADCVVSWGRRAAITGDTFASVHRARLAEFARHPATTVVDRWRLTAAGRDLYTPGMDALAALHPAASAALLSDVAPDGSTVAVEGTPLVVADHLRAPLARLRSSRRLAGCHPHEPMRGLFDQTQERRPRRR